MHSKGNEHSFKVVYHITLCDVLLNSNDQFCDPMFDPFSKHVKTRGRQRANTRFWITNEKKFIKQITFSDVNFFISHFISHKL